LYMISTSSNLKFSISRGKNKTPAYAVCGVYLYF
jgi:hypothetical protein